MRNSKVCLAFLTPTVALVLLATSAAPAGADIDPAISLPSVNGVRQLTVVDSTGPEWHTVLRNQVSKWDNPVAQLNISTVDGPSDSPTGNCPASPGTIRVCVTNYRPNVPFGWRMYTTRNQSGRIVSASIMIDPSVLQQVWMWLPFHMPLTYMFVWGGRAGIACMAVGMALGASNPSGYTCNDNGPTSAALARGASDLRVIGGMRTPESNRPPKGPN